MTYCPRCRKKNEEDAAVCSSCGTRLRPPTKEELKAEVWSHLVEEIGFDFPLMESDLSPQQRKEMSKLIPILSEYKEARAKADAKAQQALGYKPGTIVVLMILSFSFMLMLAVVFALVELLGLALPTTDGMPAWQFILFASIVCLLPIQFLVFIWTKTLGRKRLRKLEQERDVLAREADEIWKDFTTRANALATSVKEYVSATVATRVNFGRLLRALKEKGVVLKTIECPNCAGILKISEVPKKEDVIECRYCGKSILAVNLFEKFKDILGL